jgi:hypothetical protein
MKRKIGYLVLISISCLILGLAFHHHGHGVPHDNCPICYYASQYSNLAFQDTPQISIPSYNILPILLENTINIAHPFYFPYSNRAPPA